MNTPEEKQHVMHRLLSKEEEVALIPKVNDSIEGIIFDIGSNAIYLDLGRLGAGVVRGEELRTGLISTKDMHIGDKVTAVVEELDNEKGLLELSFRQAGLEKAWDDLKEKMDKKETIKTIILFANKGGLMIKINGLDGFLPVSQLMPEHYPRVEDSDKNKILSKLKDYIGKDFSVRVIDINADAKKLIVSEKAIFEEERKEALGDFGIGDIVEGKVSGVVDFGAFIKFGPKGQDIDEVSEDKKLEGLVHISELAWQLIENPRDIVKEGNTAKAKIISVDNNRVSLSIKALEEDPWKSIEDKYKVGQKVKGVVFRLNRFGAFVRLDDNIHGLTHVSKISDDAQELEMNKEYGFEILSIEPATHKMGLRLWKDKKDSKKTSSDLPKKNPDDKATRLHHPASDYGEAKKENKQ